MKLISINLRLLLGVALLLLLPSHSQAQSPAHYAAGLEGIEGASMPPPGIYVKDYNLFYTSDQVNDSTGHAAKSTTFKAFTYAQIPRFIWFTDTKFLGADVGCSILVPILYQNLKLDSYSSSSGGIGDVMADGILAWHLKQFDFVVADGIWAPTGKSAIEPSTCAGTGYWTDMVSAGATWFVDQDKTWAVSALNRYEFNTESRDCHITPGEAYTLEWGISKSLLKTVDIAAVGYYQQKVTDDSGSGASQYCSRVAAVGPEVRGVIPGIDVLTSLRYNYEFMAEDRAQGHNIVLSLTRKF